MLIIDGTYIVYKSYYIAEKIKLNYDIGDQRHFEKTARNIFLKLIAKLKNRFNPRSLFIVFDCEGDNFRHELMPSYKSNRKAKPEDLLGVKNEIYNFLQIHNFTFQIGDKVEGDDIIASFVHQNKQTQSEIFTGDADLAALVSNSVTVLLEKKKKVQSITPENFHRFFPIPPNRFPDFKSLQGDKSDGIKGVDGLFRSEVIHLFMEYTSIEEFFEKGQTHHLYSKIIKEKEKILLNKKVASMRKDCKITINEEHSRINHIYLPDKISSKINW